MALFTLIYELLFFTGTAHCLPINWHDQSFACSTLTQARMHTNAKKPVFLCVWSSLWCIVVRCPGSTNPLTLAEMKGPHCALCSLHPWPLAAACCGHSTNIHNTCRPSGDIWGRLGLLGLAGRLRILFACGASNWNECVCSVCHWRNIPRSFSLKRLGRETGDWQMCYMKRRTHSSQALPQGKAQKRGITGWCFMSHTFLSLFILDLATPRHVLSPIITLCGHASDPGPFPLMHGLDFQSWLGSSGSPWPSDFNSIRKRAKENCSAIQVGLVSAPCSLACLAVILIATGVSSLPISTSYLDRFTIAVMKK